MNDIKFLRVIIISLLVLNLGTLSYLFFNDHRGHRPEHGGHGVVDYIADELKFDEEQKKLYYQLNAEHRERIEAIQKEDRKLHDEYFDMLSIENIDQSKIDSMAALMASNRKQIEVLTFSHFAGIRKHCNESQKKKFDEIINDALRMMAPRPPH